MGYRKQSDPLANSPGNAMTACSKGVVINPSDTADLREYVKAIRVEGGGTVKFLPTKNSDGAALTVTLEDGEVFSMFQIRRVFETGTSATGIIGGLG